MIIDGNRIAHGLKNELVEKVAAFKKKPNLAVFITQEDAVVHKFVERKTEFGEEIGVKVIVNHLNPFEGTSELLQKLLHAAREHDGIIVQLPLASHIETEPIRQLMPITHDVDVYGSTAYVQFEEGRLPILPPVIAAISEILHRQNIRISTKKVVVVGQGRLVGIPAVAWATRLGAFVSSVDRDTEDIGAVTREADVLILGAGSPGLITPEHVKEGAIVLDAGTSETGGVLKGDADPSVAEKASIFTPTPGGIGPITVAMIFKNLLTLKGLRDKPSF
jgi:methylenetetrahydrofolate dehydrogenase (NADP+)/methenyltetrahydrofolate cyclohydrolase